MPLLCIGYKHVLARSGNGTAALLTRELHAEHKVIGRICLNTDSASPVLMLVGTAFHPAAVSTTSASPCASFVRFCVTYTLNSGSPCCRNAKQKVALADFMPWTLQTHTLGFKLCPMYFHTHIPYTIKIYRYVSPPPPPPQQQQQQQQRDFSLPPRRK
jgi:hypothetical protein